MVVNENTLINENTIGNDESDLDIHKTQENNISCNKINKVKEGQPHIVDMIKNGDVHLIINTTEGARSIKDSFSIRKEANNNNVCLTTTVSGAKAFCKAILFIDNFDAIDIQSLHNTIH